MVRHYSRTLLAVALVSSFGIAQAQYQFIDLHPSGFVYSLLNDGGSTQQVGDLFDSSFLSQAAIWNGSATGVTVLTTPGWLYSEGVGTDGVQQVGYFSSDIAGQHAAVWSGNGASGVDLHPSGGYYGSVATGVSDGFQCGVASGFAGGFHAFVWAGSAASAIDITPAGFSAQARKMLGTRVVGDIDFPGADSYQHAAVWNDFTPTPVDLNPAGFLGSQAYALGGGQIVGQVYTPDLSSYAALWTSGAAASFVNLNPASATGSVCLATNGTQQIGLAFFPDSAHAIVWSGTAASAVDLNQFLPVGSTGSQADAIDSAGNIYGSATVPDATYGFISHACMWKVGSANHISVFQQPINDPAAPESSFKRNSTIPVKFRLTDANGNNVAASTATISVTVLGSSETPVNEGDYITPADSGSNFRYDSGGQTYIYNLGTKGLLVGTRYRITATAGGTTHSVTITIR